MSKQRRFTWLVLILLAACALRMHDLPQTPPGMTHDEADHGLDAWGVVEGNRPIYFTVGYGREPLFDYSTALLMSFLGPSYLAGRLTAAFFSILLIAGNYAWMRRALGERAALLTAAALAVSFWPVMTGRQALRSVTMPALFVFAVYFFWRGVQQADRLPTNDSWPALRGLPDRAFILCGLFVGLTFYTYIPSRVVWLAFPALLLYLWRVGRPAPWRGAMVALLLAALLGAPLFLYLSANPQAEVRVEQLSAPLAQALAGDIDPLLNNVREGLAIFTVEGDEQWRYNIAGRPLLGPVMGLLFYVGVALAVFRVVRCGYRRGSLRCERAPGLLLALVWLLLGLSPALVTGAELSTTQTIAMQPVLYLFPALPLVALAERLQERMAAGRNRLLSGQKWLLPATGVLLFSLLFARTVREYFVEWAERPEVAVQYEADLVTVIRYLNDEGQGPVAISTDAPNRFHDPATAQLFLTNDDLNLYWFDGRHSLLLPHSSESTLIFTPGALPHPILARYLEALQPSALSTAKAIEAYNLSHALSTFLATYPHFSPKIHTLSTELSTDIIFGDVIRFLGYDLQNKELQAGDTLRLVTAWQVQEAPGEALVLFSHVLAADGTPAAQADRLDAPSYYWQGGEGFLQLHEIHLPPDLPAGVYQLAIGIYRADDWQERLPIAVDGVPQGDALPLISLTITS